MHPVLLYILAGLGGLFVLLFIIGMIVGESEEKNGQKKVENVSGSELQEYKVRQRKRLEELEAIAPSIWLNSIVMAIVQWVFGAVSVLLIGAMIYTGIYGPGTSDCGVAGSPCEPEITQEEAMITLASIWLIASIFSVFAKMVRRRNAYIIQLRGLIEK